MDVSFNWETMCFEFYASPSILEDSSMMPVLKKNILAKADSIRFNGDYSLGEVLRNNENILGVFEFLLLHPKIVSSKFTTSGEVENLYEIEVKDIVYDELIPSGAGRGFLRTPEKPSFQDTISFKIPYTGLLVDARGIGFVPSFYPRLLNEKEEVVYGVEYVFLPSLKKEGFVSYSFNIFDPAVIKRVGLNPLRIIPLRASGSNLVISNEDAIKIISSPVLSRWLRDCRIVIVIEPPARR